ncbi:hypothetical protein T11_2715, partial [Trichinella zimbabwensis]
MRQENIYGRKTILLYSNLSITLCVTRAASLVADAWNLVENVLILRTKMSHIPQVPYVSDQVQMPVMGPKDQQTLAWAHQNYIIDSGIQSAGVNTYASSTVSAVSAVSNFIEEYGDPYTPGYTREQID